jgi:hypothetical protein
MMKFFLNRLELLQRSIFMLCILITSTTSLASFASDQKVPANGAATVAKQGVSHSDREVKNLMHGFYAHLMQLKSYFVDKSAFQKKENHQEILSHFQKLDTEISNAMHNRVFASPSQKIVIESFQTHVNEMKKVFDSGNKSYAHWMLVSSTSLCMSCHTQLPQSTDATFGSVADYQGLSPEKIFEEAEFNFMLRRFDLALKGYRLVIDGYANQNFDPLLLDRSVNKVVSIFARVKRDPVGGSLQFERLYKKPHLPQVLRENAHAWMTHFNIWQKEGLDDVANMSGKQVIDFAYRHLKNHPAVDMTEARDPSVVTHLRVSGVLYEYLSQHPKGPETPEILYLLAQTEKTLGSTFFFSLSDLYLKECIVSYPHSKIAKQCYKDYEDSVVVSYSGSGGTHVPADVQSNLLRLKSLVHAD